MINTVESFPVPLRGAPLWPLLVAAYRALGEMGLIPKKTVEVYRQPRNGQFTAQEGPKIRRGAFQPSLRDLRCLVAWTRHWRAGLLSDVPSGQSLRPLHFYLVHPVSASQTERTSGWRPEGGVIPPPMTHP